MAEESERRTRQRSEARVPRRASRVRQPALKGPQVAELAREQLAQITGYEAQGVSELRRDDDGGWTATVELLELARIPPSDDLLGSYEAQFDADGDLLSYRRIRRYARGRAGNDRELSGS
jgi:hypothetical protein